MASEFDLIYRYLANLGAGSHVTLGVGDDAATLRLSAGCELVVSTDTAIEGRHFPEDTLPEYVGYRVVAAAVSDLAAMAAKPIAMTLALTIPNADELWMHGFATGVAHAVDAFGLPLVGGDLTRGTLSVTVTVMGEVPAGRAVTRQGAQVGDQIAVTGTLGDAAAGLAIINGALAGHSDVDWRLAEQLEQRFYKPSPQLDWAAWLATHASAAIDISDGLLSDLGHIAHASGVRLSVDPQAVPLSVALRAMPGFTPLPFALQGGDDYELAFTAPADLVLPLGATQIGFVEAGKGVICPGTESEQGGYDHFL